MQRLKHDDAMHKMLPVKARGWDEQRCSRAYQINADSARACSQHCLIIGIPMHVSPQPREWSRKSEDVLKYRLGWFDSFSSEIHARAILQPLYWQAVMRCNDASTTMVSPSPETELRYKSTIQTLEASSGHSSHDHRRLCPREEW